MCVFAAVPAAAAAAGTATAGTAAASVAAYVGLAATLASTAMSIMSQRQQAKQQEAAMKQSAKYNAQVAENEAAAQKALAQAELQKGADERNKVLRAGLAKQGEMVATMGASGFTLDSGTNLSLLGQSAEEIQHDANMIDQNANMAAWQRMGAASNARNEGAFSIWQGKNAGNGNSGLATAGTILGGIGQGIYGAAQISGSRTPPAKVGGKPPVAGKILRGY